MTQKETRILGCIYGLINYQLPDEYLRDHALQFERAGQRPLLGLAVILAKARASGIMTDELDAQVAYALSHVSAAAALDAESDAPMASIRMQGIWQLGYYHMLAWMYKAAEPIGDDGPGDNIKAVRDKLGMSQSAFAAALDVPQPAISNWESGKVSPNQASVAKIRRLLVTHLIDTAGDNLEG